MKTDTTILNPTITVKNGAFINANYAYIPTYSRYYYITDKVVGTNGICEIQMESDVLMSFSKDILDSTQVVTRQANSTNWKLPDDKLPINANNSIDGYEGFFDVFSKDEGTYIIATTGRGGKLT